MANYSQSLLYFTRPPPVPYTKSKYREPANAHRRKTNNSVFGVTKFKETGSSTRYVKRSSKTGSYWSEMEQMWDF